MAEMTVANRVITANARSGTMTDQEAADLTECLDVARTAFVARMNHLDAGMLPERYALLMPFVVLPSPADVTP